MGRDQVGLMAVCRECSCVIEEWRLVAPGVNRDGIEKAMKVNM